MCGIVGYHGPHRGIDVVLDGLKRLEYRGYDSAGVGFLDNGQIKIYKEVGVIENLRKVIPEGVDGVKLAIGHTRWATHGKVNVTNAHPHGDDELAIVHNGIIENASGLKKELLAKGYEFKSETDSEVFYILLKDTLREISNIEEAIFKVVSQVEGSSSFVIIKYGIDKIFSIKKGATLVCGINAQLGECFVSSDPYSMIGKANKIIFPEDEVLVVGDYKDADNLFTFKESNLEPSTRYKVEETNEEVEVDTKGNYEHFMLKEVFEQPHLINNLIQEYSKDFYKNKLQELNSLKPKFIHIIGCGTAWHAGLIIKNFIEKYTGIRVSCEQASEFRYRDPILEKDDLAIFISQSGETADTLSSQKLCKDKGLKSISILNTEGSSLYRESDLNFLTYAGKEVAVASTKAFTLQVLAGYIVAMGLGGQSDVTLISKDLNNLSQLISEVLTREENIKDIAKEIYQAKGYIFTGRGEDYPIALEGALKLKETAYVHAEGYASGELKHGPMSLIDEEMVNIAILSPKLLKKTYSNIQEVKARGGKVLVVAPRNIKNIGDIADYSFTLNLDQSLKESFYPVYINVFMQLLSYHIAKLKGTDIDKPRNLAKSVTVE